MFRSNPDTNFKKRISSIKLLLQYFLPKLSKVLFEQLNFILRFYFKIEVYNYFIRSCPFPVIRRSDPVFLRSEGDPVSSLGV